MSSEHIYVHVVNSQNFLKRVVMKFAHCVAGRMTLFRMLIPIMVGGPTL